MSWYQGILTWEWIISEIVPNISKNQQVEQFILPILWKPRPWPGGGAAAPLLHPEHPPCCHQFKLIKSIILEIFFIAPETGLFPVVKGEKGLGVNTALHVMHSLHLQLCSHLFCGASPMPRHHNSSFELLIHHATHTAPATHITRSRNNRQTIKFKERVKMYFGSNTLWTYGSFHCMNVWMVQVMVSWSQFNYCHTEYTHVHRHPCFNRNEKWNSS